MWRKQGVPTPSPLLYKWEQIINTLAGSYLTLDVRRSQKYGRVFGYHDGRIANLVVSDPQILKHMLISNFSYFTDRRSVSDDSPSVQKQLIQMSGTEWKQLRHIISPTFTSGKMKALYPMMNRAIEQMMAHIEEHHGTEFDIKHLFGSLTMDVIASCAFAVETNTHKDRDSPFVLNAESFLTFSKTRMLVLLLLPRSLRQVLGIGLFKKEPLRFLEQLANSLIAERRKQMGSCQQDLLQMLIHAGSQSNDSENVTNGDQNSGQKDGQHDTVRGSKKTLTDDEIIANVILFLVAGYETTSSLMTYLVYSLACNPSVQEKLLQEVLEAKNSDGNLNYHQIMKMPYLDAVISETLRMYPPVVRVDRQVSEESGFSFDCPPIGRIHMPRGSAVIVPIYAMHHSEEFFPHPENFDPERFMSGNKETIIPYTHVPFLIGPRNCIGMRFALTEVKLAVASLVTRYEFKKSPNTDVPLDFSRTATVMLKLKRAFVGIQKRKQDSS